MKCIEENKVKKKIKIHKNVKIKINKIYHAFKNFKNKNKRNKCVIN